MGKQFNEFIPYVGSAPAEDDIIPAQKSVAPLINKRFTWSQLKDWIDDFLITLGSQVGATLDSHAASISDNAAEIATKITPNEVDTKIANALQQVYPVGSLYTTKKNENPFTTLGFGTWVKIEGQFLVGYKSGDAEFGTIAANQNSQGGSKTVTLSALETGVPPHGHTASQLVHSHSVPMYTGGPAGSGGTRYGASGTSTPVTSSDATPSITVVDHAGTAATAHQNLPPYHTVYIWERTV